MVVIVMLGDVSMIFHSAGSFGVHTWKWGCRYLAWGLKGNIEGKE